MTDSSQPASAEPSDAPERPYVLAGWLVVLIVVLIELALLASFAGLRIVQRDLAAVDDLSLAFVDVQRGFALLESDALRAGRADDPTVASQRAKLERQARIARARLSDSDTPDLLRADIEEIGRILEQIDDAIATNSEGAIAVADLARAGQRAAKAATDRTEQVIRSDMLTEVSRTGSAATIVAAVAGLLAASGAALAVWVIRRYERLYGLALSVAQAHAAEVDASNVQLEAVDRTRKRFISVLSHELRAPLSVVALISETMLSRGDEMDDEKRNELLRSVARQARRQQRMIDDLLAVARFGQAPDARVEVVDVLALLTRLVHDAKESGMTPLPELQAPEPVLALSDPSHLEQIIDNLWTNASKYGGDRCWLLVHQTGDEVVIAVEDDGPGVPDSFVDELFQAYTQAEVDLGTDTSAPRSGLGLGLSICRELAEANGGSLTYSPRPGGGARFTLTLRAHVA